MERFINTEAQTTDATLEIESRRKPSHWFVPNQLNFRANLFPFFKISEENPRNLYF